MRKLLIILFIIPFVVNAQTHERNFVITNGQVFYEKVFNVPGIDKSELLKRLNKFMPSVPGVSQFNSDSISFSARLKDAHVPYQKYGGHSFGVWAPLKFPMSANISVQVKDSRYKVIISGINFDMTSLSKEMGISSIESLAVKKKGSQFRSSATIVDGLIILQSYLSVTFDLNNQTNQDNW